MVPGLFFRTRNGSFIPPKTIGIHFIYITKIPGDILRTKTPAELPSTEQIFIETSRLVPLICRRVSLVAARNVCKRLRNHQRPPDVNFHKQISHPSHLRTCLRLNEFACVLPIASTAKEKGISIHAQALNRENLN